VEKLHININKLKMTEISVLNCCSLLAEKILKIAFTESATAGALSVAFAFTPYSGDILLGSIVCYDADEKINILNIPKNLIQKHSPESSEVTNCMAVNAKKIFAKADIIVAVTGLTKAGGSETEEKPVGTMFIDFIFPNYHIQVKEVFAGNSHQIVHSTIKKVADIITAHLTKEDESK
jgi:nicotinamide-nucleotide amidase